MFKAMWRRIRDRFQEVRESAWSRFAFSSDPWFRWSVVGVLLLGAVGSAYVVFQKGAMAWACAITTAFSVLLILFLTADSVLYLLDLLYSSPREAIPLVRNIDPLIDRAINEAEQYIKQLEGSEQVKEISSQAREICSDFESRPPYPRVAARLIWRTIVNFLLTVFAFSLISMTLARWDAYCNVGNPGYEKTYGHDCAAVDNFGEALLHSFYYHSVIFQSLGDGSHSPRTERAQILATIETLMAFFFVILIFGGIYNAASIVRDNLSPTRFENNLIEYFTALSSSTNPTTNTQQISS